MKSRSILFTAPMVRADLDGTKTQTRRIATLTAGGHVKEPGGHRRWHPADPEAVLACPHGQPGDQLWVRETYFAWGRWETRFSAKKGRDEWHFIDMTLDCGKAYLYPATDRHKQPIGGKRLKDGITPAWWKRPAIFMPRAASRITLEITGVRVEHLQDISEADAQAEGSLSWAGEQDTPVRDLLEARLAYRQLWEEINGPGSWDLNPRVWALDFRLIP